MNLHIVLLKSGSHWVAQCLEHDVTAQALNIRDLKDSFERVLKTELTLSSLYRDGSLNHINKAPSVFWQCFGGSLESSADLAPWLMGTTMAQPRIGH